jgi:hypothetical protein
MILSHLIPINLFIFYFFLKSNFLYNFLPHLKNAIFMHHQLKLQIIRFHGKLFLSDENGYIS